MTEDELFKPSSDNPLVKEVLDAIDSIRGGADDLRDAVEAAKANKAAIPAKVFALIEEINQDAVLIDADELDSIASQIKEAEAEEGK
jgi:hypothetical protein